MKTFLLMSAVALCTPLGAATTVPADFVDVSTIPGVRVDLRYATPNNFMHENLYGDFKTAYLHPLAAEKLRIAAQRLRQEHPGWTLIVFDALRPRSVQKLLWARVVGTSRQPYVANPAHGSIHNFGFAVDLSILDDQGRELDMGTPFDDFRTLAQPRLETQFVREGKLSADQIAHRKILRHLMESAGFITLPVEWWHFDALLHADVEARYPIIE